VAGIAALAVAALLRDADRMSGRPFRDGDAEGPDAAPELPPFVLVRPQQRGHRDALTPGADGGPTLCGLEPPTGGWFLAGLTFRLFLIPCHTCRGRAAAALSTRTAGNADA
jgi:hypothetical protein